MFKKLTRKAITEAAHTLGEMAEKQANAPDDDKIDKEDIVLIALGLVVVGACGFALGRRTAPQMKPIFVMPLPDGLGHAFTF